MKQTTNNSAKSKPVTKTLSFVVTGKDQNGNDYDANSVNTLVSDLQNSNVFSKLSVMATMTRSLALGKDDAKGVINAARIQSYDAEKGEMSLLFFGKNTDLASIVDDMVIVPHVRTAYRSNVVDTITAFEIVPAMEA